MASSAARLLLEHGLDPNSHLTEHYSALHFAVWAGHTEVIRELVSAGANPDCQLRAQVPASTPLTDAIGRDRLDLVTMLLDLGASPNGDTSRESPLRAACEKGSEESVRLLLERGADPNIAGDGLQSPLAVASGKGNQRIAKMLLDAGARIDTEDPMTPLGWAALNGQADIFKLLADHLSPEALAPDVSGLNPATRAIMTALAVGRSKFVEDLGISMDDLPEWAKSLTELSASWRPPTQEETCSLRPCPLITVRRSPKEQLVR